MGNGAFAIQPEIFSGDFMKNLMYSSLSVLLRVFLMSFWKLLPIIFLSFVLILVVKVML